MFKKSFAEMLKQNLTEDSFKPPDTTSPEKQPPSHSNPVLDDVYQYYITINDIEKIYGSRSFYKKLFKEPVKMIFYWCEEDWQGILFVIYQYKDKFIYTRGSFGSCEVCDAFPDTEETLVNKFNSLQLCNNINDINIHGRYSDCTHPDLIKDFEKFKNKILKQNKKSTTQSHKKSTPQQPTTQPQQPTTQPQQQQQPQQPTTQPQQPTTQPQQPTTQVQLKQNKPITWASLFK